MLNLNFKIILLAALIPMVIGFIWYNPKVFGNAWMKATGVTPESAKTVNMPLLFGLTYVFSVMIAMTMAFVTIHQFGFQSTMIGTPGLGVEGSEVNNYFLDFMAKYGGNYRTFKHGAFHGTITGIFFALPVIAINAMFERKGFKYIFINAGYFIVSMALMGGVVCAFT